MAMLLKKWKRFRQTFVGQLILAVIYAILLALILICFTGNGQFLYEL